MITDLYRLTELGDVTTGPQSKMWGQWALRNFVPKMSGGHFEKPLEKRYRSFDPKLYSIFHRGIFIVSKQGRHRVYYNGKCVGYENEQWGNLVIDWQKLKKTQHDS